MSCFLAGAKLAVASRPRPFRSKGLLPSDLENNFKVLTGGAKNPVTWRLLAMETMGLWSPIFSHDCNAAWLFLASTLPQPCLNVHFLATPTTERVETFGSILIDLCIRGLTLY